MSEEEEGFVCTVAGPSSYGVLHKPVPEDLPSNFENEIMEAMNEAEGDIHRFIGLLVERDGYRYDTDENLLVRGLMEDPDLEIDGTDGIVIRGG